MKTKTRIYTSILVGYVTFVVLIAIGLTTLPVQPAIAQAKPPRVPTTITSTVAPRNVILFIGDGMGPAQVQAAGMYQNGAAGTLVMESLPYSTTMTTHAANSAVTDSAAAATAMATGHKVNNGVISVALPGDGSALETALERFHTHCKAAGLVTTAYATHATPAAFGAHDQSRYNYQGIADDYLTRSMPDVLFGGGSNGLTPSAALAAGYVVVEDRAGMQALPPGTGARVSGQFGTTHLPYEYDYFTGTDAGYDTLPHLTEMVTTALHLLETAPNGFFLMVEGGRIDHAGHANDIARNVFETLEFDRAIQIAYAWAATRSDTLIVVTADHETGGLVIDANNGAGHFPTVTWTTTGHTATPVPVYAWGVNAELLSHLTDNTHIDELLVAGMPATAGCAPNFVSIAGVRGRTGDGGLVIIAVGLLSAGMLLPAKPTRSQEK